MFKESGTWYKDWRISEVQEILKGVYCKKNYKQGSEIKRIWAQCNTNPQSPRIPAFKKLVIEKKKTRRGKGLL